MQRALDFVLLLAALCAPAAGQSCQVNGQIFGIDTVEHTLIIKTDSGEMVNVTYDRSTVFLHVAKGPSHPEGAPPIQPDQLNVGDRLCVQLSSDKRTATSVMATLRGDIDTRAEPELAAWQAQSIFGVVTAIDPKRRQLTVTLSRSRTNVQVDASGDVAYGMLPAGSLDLRTVAPIIWEKLAQGDAVYARGETKNGTMRAALIISGGFRSLAGRVQSMDALNEWIEIGDIASGRSLKVRVRLGDLYLMGKPANTGARPFSLIEFADLKPGDPVLVLAFDNGQSDLVQALAMIAGFSWSGIVPVEPDPTMRWIFEPLHVKLGR